MPKIKFYTFGCKANQYDTQAMREDFLKKGIEESSNGIADIYIVNTCVVTRKAENESRALIRKLNRNYPKARVIVRGCLSRYDTAGQKREESALLLNEQAISFFAGHKRAFLKVQDGCDNFCSYCIVPYVRGRSRSKEIEIAYEEFSRLLDFGHKEIVLTGICLGDYGRDLSGRVNLVDLISRLIKKRGNYRIRLSSLDPQYVSRDLIELVASSNKICPHLHIPFQSGDNKILKAMHRKYDLKFAHNLVNKIKSKIKNVAITTDIIVGFPGEKEHNFLNTVKFLEFLSPLKAHLFRFSPRPPARAAGFAYPPEPGEVNRRYKLLYGLEEKWRSNYLAGFVGKKFSVLIEEKLPRLTDSYSGYSEYYFRTIIRASRDLRNSLVEAKGTEVKGDSLLAKL